MADDLGMALTNLLRKAEMAGDVDCLRDGVRIPGQPLMDLEVSRHLRAEKNERTPERAGHRNGYRARQWDTRVGTVELQVPGVWDGSFFPSLLEPRRRAERALVGVVQEAYVQGVSTRRPRYSRKEQTPGNGVSIERLSIQCQWRNAFLSVAIVNFRRARRTFPLRVHVRPGGAQGIRDCPHREPSFFGMGICNRSPFIVGNASRIPTNERA